VSTQPGDDHTQHIPRIREQPHSWAVPAPRPQPSHAQAAPYPVLPRNPAIAVLASFFVPGLGSMLNEKAGKGVLILSLYLVSIVLMFFLIGFVTGLAVWIWGMVAAHNDAREWNRLHGITS
jgi:TM2 domain-containing membrane protein YozV